MRYTLKPAEAGGGGGDFDGPAELPRVQVDTTYSAPTGTTWVVNSGDNFQTALNSAALNDIIQLEAGATFTGPFTLPNKTSGNGWIYIVSSALGSLPAAGTRVGPSDASNMAHLVSSTSNVVVSTANAAHHYRFVGIEVSPSSGVFLTTLLDFTGPSGTEASLPHHLVVDRCYIHGDVTQGARRGISLNCATAGIVDSYISECKQVGTEAQAIGGWSGPGPFKVVNNYVQGAGENMMLGGADPTITNLIPTDIEIKQNHFFKPLTWRVGDPSYGGTHWTVKNLFELKLARRALIEGNLFEQNWVDAQQGFGVLFTTRNDEGSATWATVEDVTFRYNVVRKSASGISVLGKDDINTSAQGARLSIHDNLIVDIGGSWGGTGRLFMIKSAVDIVIQHNTGHGTGTVVMADPDPTTGFEYNYNISPHNDYGVFGSGYGIGLSTLNYYFPGYVFVGNVLADHPEYEGNYPANNYFPDAFADVDFVDLGSGDYRLAGTSPYKGVGPGGSDLGIDKEALDDAMGSLAQTYW